MNQNSKHFIVSLAVFFVVVSVGYFFNTYEVTPNFGGLLTGSVKMIADGRGRTGDGWVRRKSTTLSPAPIPTPTPAPTSTPAPLPAPIVAAATTSTTVASPTPTSTTTTPAVISTITSGSAATPVPPSPTPAPAPSPASPVVAASYPQTKNYGISTGNTLVWMSSADLNQELDDIAHLGFGWVRFDMAWVDVQGTSSKSYNWTNMDRIVAAMHARNLQMLPILAYTPAWARMQQCNLSEKCAPQDPAAYAEFARQAVRRYASQGVHQWEIWNEPNLTQFYQPAPDAVQYTAMLKASYAAIKAEDPSAVVISGGLSPLDGYSTSINSVTFLDQMYKAGAATSFDAVAMHPYSYPVPASYVAPWNAWTQLGWTTPNVRGTMDKYGDTGKQIWLTEYGSPTGGPGAVASVSMYNFNMSPDHVDEALQSTIVQDAFTARSTLGNAGPLFWYSYKDLGTSNVTNENFFGLLHNDGTPKPAYNMFKTLLSTSK